MNRCFPRMTNTHRRHSAIESTRRSDQPCSLETSSHLRHESLESNQIVLDFDRRPIGDQIRDRYPDQFHAGILAFVAVVRLREEIEVGEDRFDESIVLRR